MGCDSWVLSYLKIAPFRWCFRYYHCNTLTPNRWITAKGEFKSVVQIWKNLASTDFFLHTHFSFLGKYLLILVVSIRLYTMLGFAGCPSTPAEVCRSQAPIRTVPRRDASPLQTSTATNKTRTTINPKQARSHKSSGSSPAEKKSGRPPGKFDNIPKGEMIYGAARCIAFP